MPARGVGSRLSLGSAGMTSYIGTRSHHIATQLAHFGAQVADRALERGALALELENAPRQVGRRRDRSRLSRLLGPDEIDSHLIALAPLHPDLVHLLLGRKIEFDDIRDGNRIREHQLGAALGNVAHEAIGAGAALMVVDAPLQETPLARRRSAFLHGSLFHSCVLPRAMLYQHDLKIISADYRIVHTTLASSLLS